MLASGSWSPSRSQRCSLSDAYAVGQTVIASGSGSPRQCAVVTLGRWAPLAYGWLALLGFLGIGVPAISLTNRY